MKTMRNLLQWYERFSSANPAVVPISGGPLRQHLNLWVTKKNVALSVRGSGVVPLFSERIPP